MKSFRINDIESQGLYSNPVGYYDFLQNRVLVLFKPKFEDSDPEAEFNLVLSKKQNYDIVCSLSQSMSHNSYSALDGLQGSRTLTTRPH